MKIAVLASGSGTILDAMVGCGIDVSLVLVDRPCKAEGLSIDHGIALSSCYRRDFSRSFDRVGYTNDVLFELVANGIELIAMAGYGTILEEPIHERYAGRILNTHPSLLPAFAGWHAVSEALKYGVRVTGCTVHLATLAVDAGPILAQEAIEVNYGDDESSLHERIKKVERRLYPQTVAAYNDYLDTNFGGSFFEYQKMIHDANSLGKTREKR
ncbi:MULTISPECIES: phosphoribosylglycinamide formyltransferase [Acidithrix]|uniref:Phosphoribosylglycinamide formyltransferase n=1 Tax=Acidithrix ferrooxidans TaxID=1280514 RepID=A0A0D8HEK5_9ACTN|nr:MULTISPECIES: phosphoribosylglycinamide formyltransferase [Acidithrix]KJF16247.1 phosphoribosylglycinamide formyltransferase [Acidithrix ferrooxidans]